MTYAIMTVDYWSGHRWTLPERYETLEQVEDALRELYGPDSDHVRGMVTASGIFSGRPRRHVVYEVCEEQPDRTDGPKYHLADIAGPPRLCVTELSCWEHECTAE